MEQLFLGWQDKVAVAVLMYARITPIFMIVPVLNTSVLANMQIRNAIIFAMIAGLWPVLGTEGPDLGTDLLAYAALILKEVVVGMSVGFVLALPFWIFNAMGSYIDIARGASMGSMLDMTSGQESTEVEHFVGFCVCVVYLELGGFTLILETLIGSYQQIGLHQQVRVNFDQIASFLSLIFGQGFVLAAPVLLTLLMLEALLGLLSRFTPQLSAFSVAMTVKTSLALCVLSLYFWQFMPERLMQLAHTYAHWQVLDVLVNK